MYIDGVEFDVRVTRDNKLVVFHDGILNFKSDGYGFVRDKSYDDVTSIKLDNGYNIVGLDVLLASIDTNKIIMIEVKDKNVGVDVLYEIISKYDFDYRIISFHYDFLVKFKRKYPKYKVGILIMFLINTKYFYNDFDFNIVEYSYYRRISKYKEAFIFNVNDKYKCENIYKYSRDFNIISDNIYLLK